jgi:exodeoxyribonuclease V gamma subunit
VPRFARDTLPPGALGEPVIRELYPIVEAVLSAVRSVVPQDAEPGPIDVHAQLPDSRVLSGTVPGVYGDVLLQSTFSRVSGKHRLASWVRLLAATASHPERPFSAATIGRAAERATVTIAQIKPLGVDTESRRRVALDHLAAWPTCTTGECERRFPSIASARMHTRRPRRSDATL